MAITHTITPCDPHDWDAYGVREQCRRCGIGRVYGRGYRVR